jgi:hypothetical protein
VICDAQEHAFPASSLESQHVHTVDEKLVIDHRKRIVLCTNKSEFSRDIG